MKKFILASIIGVFSLTVLAQTATTNDTITIKPSEPSIAAPRQIRPMAPDEFSRFIGSYELSNGKSLALFSRGLKKYAAVHGEAWHEIVATASNTFVAVDRQLQMKIDRQENGDASGELLMVVPSDQLTTGDAHEHVVVLALH